MKRQSQVLFLVTGIFFVVIFVAGCIFVRTQTTLKIETPMQDTASADDVTIKPQKQEEEGVIDLRLPSQSTDGGSLAVRLYVPKRPRYNDGVPVIVWIPGGYEQKGINHELPDVADDIMVATFLFPGVTDEWSGFSSDGVYDWRGENCIRALADVILFLAGQLTDEDGNTIDDVASVPVLHNNIGAIGVSNGGNLPVAAAALFGDELEGYLRYIIQWETPVSSQIANRDFGRVWIKEGGPLNTYFNQRYQGYGDYELGSTYDDLVYDSDQENYRIFHDGNGDGVYSTTQYLNTPYEGPDLDRDGVLALDEDFPLDAYQGGENGETWFYSRPVTRALKSNNIFGDDGWPDDIATVQQVNEYWDIRESVQLYDDAVKNIPDLEVMVLAGLVDHVQTNPEKPHIRQALEGWLDHGVSWVQLNPDPKYVVEAYPGYKSRTDLPENKPNKAPRDWSATSVYTMPEDIEKAAYQLAGVYQMMDRVQK